MKKILIKSVLLLPAFFAVGLFMSVTSDCVFADELSDMNTNTEQQVRRYEVSPEQEFVVDTDTGVTAQYVMTVVGQKNQAGEVASTINYYNEAEEKFFRGFTVESGITLNLTDLLIKNAKAESSGGSVVTNAGNLNINNVTFTGNSVYAPDSAVYGGAIYNEGNLIFSGNLYNNYIFTNDAENAGGIYTTNNATLTANGKDYSINNNRVMKGDDVYNIAIYVADKDKTLTISATNGGSWTINDKISGNYTVTAGTYDRYKVNITGDMNSIVNLGNEIEHALVKINGTNVSISKDVFRTCEVHITGDTFISTAQGEVSDYGFAVYRTDYQAANPRFELKISDTANDTITVGAGSFGEIIVDNIVFSNGIQEGTFNILHSSTQNANNVQLALSSNEGTYVNITPDIVWTSTMAPIKKYTYTIVLDTTTSLNDSITISNVSAGETLDALFALNTYRTTYDRTFSFNPNETSAYVAGSDLGVNTNLSKLFIKGNDEISTININGYSGFNMVVGSDINVSNIKFQNAVTGLNGSVFNISTSNASLSHSGGSYVGNSADGFGGAIYIEASSFLNLHNVNFEGNTANSGGAIYVYSNGTSVPYVTELNGNFENNSASLIGGAVANYTDYSTGINRSVITSVIGGFNTNGVTAVTDDNVYGGAIYNTGDIQYLNGNFSGNYAVATAGNAFGGAIANTYVVDANDVVHSGAIHDITATSFSGNYASSESGKALGGAIYTADDLVFNVSGDGNSMSFSGNYVVNNGVKTSNAIFADTANGDVALTFNVKDNAELTISDAIEFGHFDTATGDVTRDASLSYNLSFIGDGTSDLKFNDVKDYTTDEVVNGIINGNVRVYNMNLTSGTKTFADNDTTLRLESSVFNTQDENISVYEITKLESFASEYKIDLSIAETLGNYSVVADSFKLGQGSKGVINLKDIGINTEEEKTAFYAAAEDIALNTEDGYKSVQILDRTANDDGTYNAYLNLDLTTPLPDKVKTVSYDGQVYYVNDTDFVGSYGIKVNEDKDSIVIGTTDRTNTLRAINIYVPDGSDTSDREFNLNSATFNVNENLGVTAKGTLTVKGSDEENRTLNFTNGGKTYTGFDLDSENNAVLNISYLTISKASYGISSDNDGVVAGNYNVVLNNVTFSENDVAIANTNGRISITNSTFDTPQENQEHNKVINNDYMFVEKTNFYSSVDNNGNILAKGTVVFGKNNGKVFLSGSGNLLTPLSDNNDGLLDLRNATVFNKSGSSSSNTVTINSGTLAIGSGTFAENSTLVLNKGVVDLALTNKKTPGAYERSDYFIDNYSTTDSAATDEDTGFVVTMSFKNMEKPTDTINIANATEGSLLRVVDIYGFDETLSTSIVKDKSAVVYINILNDQSGNVALKVNDSFLVDEVFDLTNYKYDYPEETPEGMLHYYQLKQDDFIGRLTVEQNGNTGLKVIKEPLYNGISEMNQLDPERYTDYNPADTDRKFVLTEAATDPDNEYSAPINFGKTREGYMTVKLEDDADHTKLAQINMQYNNVKMGGFEVTSEPTETTSGMTNLTLVNLHIMNAGTGGYYDELNPTTTIREEKRGSVLFMDSPVETTKATIIDSYIEENIAEGLGGAIYTKNDLKIVAQNRNTIFRYNIQNQTPKSTGVYNDIYVGKGDLDPTLELYAYGDKGIYLQSGLNVDPGTNLTIKINDKATANDGIVKIVFPERFATAKAPIKNIEFNGGIFDIRDYSETSDAAFSNIYTKTITINEDTKYYFDFDLKTGKSDTIWTYRQRNITPTNESKILITYDNLMQYGTDVFGESVKLRLFKVKSATSNFMKFLEADGETQSYSLNLGTYAGHTYYAILGLNGSIIVGYNPDCSEVGFVPLLPEVSNKTYKLETNLKLFNYGSGVNKAVFNSKKFTIKGDSVSVIDTPVEIEGISIEDTEKYLAKKKQFVGSKFTMKGFKGAFENYGGKLKLTNVNLISNETDASGAGIQNYLGSATVSGSKKLYADVYGNVANDKGGAIYNEGTLSAKYVNFGRLTDAGGTYENNALLGGAIYTIAKATVSNSNFIENDADLMGGAIYTAENTKYSSNNYNLNRAPLGGAIYVNATPDKKKSVSVSKGNFYYNNAYDSELVYEGYDTEQGRGGAIFIEKGKVSISKANFGSAAADTVNGNTALKGGAIYNAKTEVDPTISAYNVTTVSSSKFAQNSATLGGAVYNDGTLTLKKNTFGLTDKLNNTFKNSAETGGTIYNTGVLTDSSSKIYYGEAIENADEENGKGGGLYNSTTGYIVKTNKKQAVTGGLNSTKFSYNKASKSGGAIYNDGDLGMSKASFTYNTALNGAALYNSETGVSTVIKSTFYNNGDIYDAEGAPLTYGGAIYNLGRVEISSSTFGKAPNTKKGIVYENIATYGGAVYNTAETSFYIDKSSKYNYNRAAENGGAVYNGNYGLAMLTSDTFTGNVANDKGGAVYIADKSVAQINSSTFKNNSAQYGGAIYVGKEAYLQIVDTSFTNNNVTKEHGGGALYLDRDSETQIIANKKNITIKGNTTPTGNYAIYMNGNKDGDYTHCYLYLYANAKRKITLNDYIEGTGTVYTTGTVVFASQTSFGDIEVVPFEGTLVLDTEETLNGKRLSMLPDTGLGIANNKIGTLALNTLTIEDGVANVALDADLKTGKTDKITAETVEGTGILNVSALKLSSDSKRAVTLNLGEDSVVSTMSAKEAETAQATYKLKSSLDSNGNLMATAYGQKAKPCTLAAPVAAQIGGYLTQINSYDQAFANMDMNMLLTREERDNEVNKNKVNKLIGNASDSGSDSSYSLINSSPINFENGINRNGKGLWTRPYATFEKVSLSHGPKVGTIAYGNFFGGDADVKYFGNGWKRQFSAYIGYNGSTLDFDKQSVDQNGGTIGITEVWYKKNFFTGLTLNVGANAVNASTDLGHENFPMLMAGIASKTGYNFEFKQGKFIIQPSLLLSYSFVHTFAHKNGLGNHVGSSPLHAVQVAPGLKFICNLPKGWQPYLGINMRWNIIDKTHFSLPDVNIPDMSIDPYVEYGLGLQRKWGERFTGFGQAMIRNGGRNGIMLSFGFKWALGK